MEHPPNSNMGMGMRGRGSEGGPGVVWVRGRGCDRRAGTGTSSAHQVSTRWYVLDASPGVSYIVYVFAPRIRSVHVRIVVRWTGRAVPVCARRASVPVPTFAFAFLPLGSSAVCLRMKALCSRHPGAYRTAFVHRLEPLRPVPFREAAPLLSWALARTQISPTALALVDVALRVRQRVRVRRLRIRVHVRVRLRRPHLPRRLRTRMFPPCLAPSNRLLAPAPASDRVRVPPSTDPNTRTDPTSSAPTKHRRDRLDVYGQLRRPVRTW